MDHSVLVQDNGRSELSEAIPLSDIDKSSQQKPKVGYKPSSDHATGVLEEETPEPGNENLRTKKPLSFKLAFTGLASAVFVFQIDATALGIALPVSFTD